MIKLKLLLEENMEIEKENLLTKYPGEYYVISNYGHGDGHCSDGLNSFDALMLHRQENDHPDIKHPSWVGHITLAQDFSNRLRKPGIRKSNYISDQWEDFGGDPGDI